jgi:hypothetical protein
MIVDRNWVNHVEDEDRRLELGKIVCAVLDVGEAEGNEFLNELRGAAVKFLGPGEKG